MAMHAVYQNGNLLLAFSPLVNEGDYTARSQINFSSSSSSIFERSSESISFIVGDNKPKNPKMAADMCVYFIGCCFEKNLVLS